MAVRMRLRREGKRKQPFYRVVVADGRAKRDGRFIEDIGYYHPLREPSHIAIDEERALYWLQQGVQPSDAVRQLLRVTGIWEQFRPGDPGRQRASAVRAAAAAQTAAAASGVSAAAEDTAASAEVTAPAAAEDTAPSAEGSSADGAGDTAAGDSDEQPA